MLTVVKMQKVKLSKLSADSVKESAHGGRENYRQADERSGAQRAHRWPEGCCRKWLVRGPALRHGESLQESDEAPNVER